MRTIILLVIISFLAKKSFSQSKISLYDESGYPIAYISTTEDWTIYLWEGKPVAYIINDGQILHVFGFNGKHLGWYSNGIIRDHKGYAAGFKKGAILNVDIKLETYKGYKDYIPYKSYREYTLYQPYFSAKFSSVNLSGFLYQGVGNETLGPIKSIYDAPDPIMQTDLNLLATVNLRKQALFDHRTGILQDVINQIGYYLNGVIIYDTTEYIEQNRLFRSNVKTISSSRIDIQT